MSRSGRALVLAVVALAVLGSLAACRSQFAALRLTIATGSSDGVYFVRGTQLADVWANQLGIARPAVRTTAGSVADIQRLESGAADVGFADADVLTQRQHGRYAVAALARIYDDYIQVVVRADEPIDDLADLAGHRVSIGPTGSQTQVVADRILGAARVHDMTAVRLSLNDSITALRSGRIDGFFWSGGLPTQGFKNIRVPFRLLNLGTDPSGVLQTMLTTYKVYGTGLVPAGIYSPGSPSVTTLIVPNFLLASTKMSDDVAEALVRSLFTATGPLADELSAALGINVHTAIFTEPVPLHPGAEAYYRSAKI
ncbi:MAG TPA: TAXI family TRAP transporter solute-binding subunit [Pseudonocardiaceae bacterium]|nr:TAXI family TRAP transporter solute-binding subunit [Pseudonocardiaceae bacterium]